MFGCAQLLRALYLYRDRDSRRILRLLRLATRREGEQLAYHRRGDELFAVFPFLWTWLEIGAVACVAAVLPNGLAFVACAVIVAGRMRALQEYGHNAVHFALCRSKAWQWWLGEVFFQFPCFKRTMPSRFDTHTRQHHRYPNHPDMDPNRQRVIAGGVRPGITRAQFVAACFYPLGPKGQLANARVIWSSCTCRHTVTDAIIRISAVAIAVLYLYGIGGWWAVGACYVVPLLTTYPLFSWWALLAEHRWFAPQDHSGRHPMELAAGRPTDYPGLSGALVRCLVSPASDAYHLVHSLYPGVRWTFLPALDKHLKKNDPMYTEFASVGLFMAGPVGPSALSELMQRVTGSARESRNLGEGR